MDTLPSKRNNTLLTIAAIAVIIFSGVGVAAFMGWIPSSTSGTPDAYPVGSADTSHRTATNSSNTSSAPATPRTSAPRPAPVVSHAPRPYVEPERQPVRTAAVCDNCGVVAAVNVVQQPAAQGSGLGAVVGGVAGAVLGNQVGQGNGRTIATLAGAAGGAYAGNEVEKRTHKTSHYEVVVRLDNGTTRVFTESGDAGFAVGEKVRIIDGKLAHNG